MYRDGDFIISYQLSGSLGLSEGCGCRITSPSRLTSLKSTFESTEQGLVTSCYYSDGCILRAGSESLMVDVPGGAAIWRSSRIPKPILVVPRSANVKKNGNENGRNVVDCRQSFQTRCVEKE